MTEALYEQYKDALRRGHVASKRGRLDDALDAYGEAARVAPDRALPLVGIGQVLARLGKTAEALATFDRALDRAPADEVALRGRTDLLVALGDRVGAAETLDRLAAVVVATGRPAEALDLAREALELAEARARREELRSMVEAVRADPGSTPADVGAVARAAALLAGPIGPEPPPPPPPFDPVAAMAAVEDATASGDADAAREAALRATQGYRGVGQLDAAFDACYQVLTISPADPGIHLALAELYVDRGWKSVASDKLVLLASLLDLGDDETARARLCDVAARIADDPRLDAICA